MMKKNKHILVVKNRAMGDSIIGLSSLQYLRECYPCATITYAIPEWMVPLYKDVTTAADKVIGLNLKGPQDWIKSWYKIKRLEVDFVYELFQSGRSAKFFNIFSKIYGIPYYFHNHHNTEPSKVYDQGIIKPVIQRDLDGVWSYFSNSKTDARPDHLQYPPVMSAAKVSRKKQIIFGIVATRKTKMWDLQYYAKLAEMIKEHHPEYEIIVPISSSELDQCLKAKLAQISAGKLFTFVEAPLGNLPKYFFASELYIGNDTGIKHLAVACGIKTITLFGPEPPLEWHPYNQKNHTFFFIKNLECRTMNAHYCGLSLCDHMSCLKEISPETIYEHAKNIICPS